METFIHLMWQLPLISFIVMFVIVGLLFTFTFIFIAAKKLIITLKNRIGNKQNGRI